MQLLMPSGASIHNVMLAIEIRRRSRVDSFIQPAVSSGVDLSEHMSATETVSKHAKWTSREEMAMIDDWLIICYALILTRYEHGVVNYFQSARALNRQCMIEQREEV